MRVFDAAATRAALPFPELIAALRAAFAAGATVPLRHRHDLPGAGEPTLLLMPAWQGGQALGVKLVSVFPENGARGLPAVSSTYLLLDAATGAHRAVIDGGELTARRTAAASALAGDYLARPDASRLLVVGSGHVARQLPAAWCAVRPIAHVAIWNRHPESAAALAAALAAQGMAATACTDLRAAVDAADIVSCATLAHEPLIRGDWLRPGTHLDLIGGYRPDMREADDACVRRAAVYIDTEAALAEAGDLMQPIVAGILAPATIRGTLAELCRGTAPGRADAAQITLFKSVGSALEDLAAAALVDRL